MRNAWDRLQLVWIPQVHSKDSPRPMRSSVVLRNRYLFFLKVSESFLPSIFLLTPETLSGYSRQKLFLKIIHSLDRAPPLKLICTKLFALFCFLSI